MAAGPDLSYEFSVCFLQIDALYPGALAPLQSAIQTSLDSLNSQMNGFFSNPVYQSACVNGHECGGIWGAPPDPTPATAAALETAALNNINILPAGKLFAFELAAGAIEGMVSATWATTPRRYNTAGVAVPNGQIELKGYKLQIQNPIVLTINGTDHDTVDVNFNVTYKFTLSAAPGGGIQCNSESSVDVNIGWLEALLWVFCPFPVAWYLQNTISQALANISLPTLSLGGYLSQVFPSYYMIPGGKKLVFIYDTLAVDATKGIFAAGSEFPLQNRQPAAKPSGDVDVIVPFLSPPEYPSAKSTVAGETAIVVWYTAVTVDMRGPLTYAWRAQGVVANPTSQSTAVTLQFEPTVGVKRIVSVSVTDADGLNASAQATFSTIAAPPRPKGGTTGTGRPGGGPIRRIESP